MTTQAPAPVEPVPAPPAAPAAPPARSYTMQDIAARIEQRLSEKMTITSRVVRVVWFPRKTALQVQQELLVTPTEQHKELYRQLGFTIFNYGEVCPVTPGRKIFEMFEDPDEIRVYTYTDGKEAWALAVLRLSRSAAIFSIREMTPQAFIDAVVNEWSELQEGAATDETEREAILAYGQDVVGRIPSYPLADFLDDIDGEVHLEDPEDDEDDASPDESPEGSGAPEAPTDSATSEKS